MCRKEGRLSGMEVGVGKTHVQRELVGAAEMKALDFGCRGKFFKVKVGLWLRGGVLTLHV